MLIAETGNAARPFTFDRRPTFEFEAQVKKEIDCAA
jgi:hypothetical protein